MLPNRRGLSSSGGCCFRKLTEAVLESPCRNFPAQTPLLPLSLNCCIACSVLTHQHHLGLSLSPRVWVWVVVLPLISASHYPGTPSLSHTVSDPDHSDISHPHKQDPIFSDSETPLTPSKDHTSHGAGRSRVEIEDDDLSCYHVPATACL